MGSSMKLPTPKFASDPLEEDAESGSTAGTILDGVGKIRGGCDSILLGARTGSHLGFSLGCFDGPEVVVMGGVEEVERRVPVVLPGVRMIRPTTSDSFPSPARLLNIQGTSSRFMLGEGRAAMCAGFEGLALLVDAFGIFTDFFTNSGGGCCNDDDEEEVEGSDETLDITESLGARFVNLANGL